MWNSHFQKFWILCEIEVYLSRAQPRACTFCAHQCILLMMKMIFDYLIVFVTLKSSKLCLYEVLTKQTRFKVGDGLIFGYVLRRHHFFEKSVACNEAHKNQRIQGKNKKLSKSQRVMHFWVYISKPQKVVTLMYGEKAPTLRTFKVRHRGVTDS